MNPWEPSWHDCRAAPPVAEHRLENDPRCQEQEARSLRQRAGRPAPSRSIARRHPGPPARSCRSDERYPGGDTLQTGMHPASVPVLTARYVRHFRQRVLCELEPRGDPGCRHRFQLWLPDALQRERRQDLSPAAAPAMRRPSRDDESSRSGTKEELRLTRQTYVCPAPSGGHPPGKGFPRRHVVYNQIPRCDPRRCQIEFSGGVTGVVVAGGRHFATVRDCVSRDFWTLAKQLAANVVSGQRVKYRFSTSE